MKKNLRKSISITALFLLMLFLCSCSLFTEKETRLSSQNAETTALIQSYGVNQSDNITDYLEETDNSVSEDSYKKDVTNEEKPIASLDAGYETAEFVVGAAPHEARILRSSMSPEAKVPIPTALTKEVVGEDGTVSLTVQEPEKPYENIVWNSCQIEGSEVVLKASLNGSITPANTEMGKDTNIYILELQPYEDDIAGHRYVSMLPKNSEDLTFRLPLYVKDKETRLYNKFVACIWDGTKYIQVSNPAYITNPEYIAKNRDPYIEPITKKGLLIELSQIADAMELGVHSVIVNIPYNALFGEGIEYTYEGETYHFNKKIVEDFDHTISTFSNKQINVNAILLNGWMDSTPDYYYPGTKKSGAAFYHFNSKTEKGYKAIKAIASFLAERYSGQNPNYGKVQNWIIGNEINNQHWNYIGPMSLDNYVKEFERSFRIFYTAIKSTCANDRVYFSVDHHWMNEANGFTRYNAKRLIEKFADLVNKNGNIDWGLAYHPYSVPLVEPEFWDDAKTGLVNYSENSPIVNFANLSVLTDFMQKPNMLDRQGKVRHIILSEQGFTSQSLSRGKVEKLQAAAFAYAYYIVDSNPYIDTFILSRQIDAPSEAKNSCAFGLWTTESTDDGNILPAKRKFIWPVFRDIDKKNFTLEATEFAKEILGIKKWSDVIPDFKWKSLEE